ncbi:MAG: 2-oxoacid:ferredoxin oxidoreductase subunit beta [Calditrichaeota bacterium]|nr:MAG: 2-oxoacid:ferredoxin oxidoreductase subunit beta [Calditrichota bacterium]
MADKVSVAGSTEGQVKEDFSSDQDVRWCPGCGDYAILAQMKRVLPELGIPREKIVFVSGIGCSSRFPYYLNTYGFHTIHGRAPTVATGLKLANPDLSVWVITGDGDGLSIGASHLMHLFRRNVNVNVILFNNQIYGLTKGQYSPTSPLGKVTKTTPYGSLDAPFNPLAMAVSAGASFVARTIDRHTKHMAEIFRRAAMHEGCSFVEVYQNCNIYNDGAFHVLTDPQTRDDHVLYLQDGQPLIFGKEKKKALRFREFSLEVVEVEGDTVPEGVLVHREQADNDAYPYLLARMSDHPDWPTPVGVLRAVERPTYERLFHEQIQAVMDKKGKGDLKQLFISGDTWKVD